MRPVLFALLGLVLVGAAPPATDWRESAREGRDGWSFGRPEAPLLAEYASFGCPHCGHFAAEAGPAIDAAVKAGKLRFSWRPFLIFPQDRAAAVLTRCVPAARRFAFIEAVMAAQAETKTRLAAADASDQQRQRRFEASLGGPEREAPVIAEQSGLQNLAIAHGLTPVAASTCLADPANYAWVADADMAGRLEGITNTPTFALAGKVLPRDVTPAGLVALLPR